MHMHVLQFSNTIMVMILPPKYIFKKFLWEVKMVS